LPCPEPGSRIVSRIRNQKNKNMKVELTKIAHDAIEEANSGFIVLSVNGKRFEISFWGEDLEPDTFIGDSTLTGEEMAAALRFLETSAFVQATLKREVALSWA
jgi:hypothetical protein